jgi:tetratricopeptide (TPR) repeat protein
MWWCLLLGIGSIGLVLALIYFNHKRQQGNEYDAIGPMTLKLGASGVLILIVASLLSMGPLGGLLSIAPLFILGLLWTGPLMDWIGGGAIDSIMGGGQEVEPKPLYSIAETKWHRGDPEGAIAEIDSELEKFPGDYDGQVLKATIQLEALRDFNAAQGTMLEITQQPHHEPGQIASAMNMLADWQLKHLDDKEIARGTLESIVKRFPNTGIELMTAQRLARMDFLLDYDDKRDTGEVVSDCLKQLEKHPLDVDTREKLARVYFNRYDKPDLAWQEMAKLFENPFQHPRDIARWLNRMADWHLRKNNPKGARECLQQIMVRFPQLPFCEEAQQRLTLIKEL